MEQMKNFALLIDADNVSARYVKNIFDELSSYGSVSIRRIYGNWSKSYDWNETLLLEYSIQPMHQFEYTKGKNATDMLMVIDAMDILYSGNVDGFCIVTSDSDFTRLAMRLREARKYVIGMGESKTPAALVKACDRFIHLNLIAEEEESEVKSAKTSGSEKESAARSASKSEKKTAVTTVSEVEEAIVSYINHNDDGEFVALGAVGNMLKQKFTDFDVRNYGYSQLNVFVRQKCGKLSIRDDAGVFSVGIKEKIGIDAVKNEITDIIRKNGGTVAPLSIITNELVEKHKQFNIKNYGYSRMSSFLRSFPELTVSGNTVKLKGNAQ